MLPLPGALRGGVANKVVAALLASGLAEEQVTDSTIDADPASCMFWRSLDDGQRAALRITPVGLAAIGIEPGSARP